MRLEESDQVSMTVEVLLQADQEFDLEDCARLTRRLCAELDELDIDSIVEVSKAAAPDGAKGADVVTVGALVVALSAPGGVLPSLIAAVRDWLDRQHGRHRVKVTIEEDTIELDRATAEQQQRLVEAFVRRHTV